jgi:hypothetical protein
MRFLHPKWNPHVLALSVIELCLSCLPIASGPNRVGCAGRATADRERQPIE